MPSFGRWQINKMLHLSFILKAMKTKRKQVPLDIVNLESFNEFTWSTALSFNNLYVIRAFYIHFWNHRANNYVSFKNILLNLIPCETRVSHGHIISSYLYILYIQIKHVEISNCQSFHHQSNTTFFLKCISFRRGSSIGKGKIHLQTHVSM